jgi:hypothetical protein
MKRFLIALAALVTLGGTMATTASAVEFGVGPGGVYVGPDHHRYYRDYSDDYAGCRVIVTHRTNRYGEDVTVRRRVCD